MLRRVPPRLWAIAGPESRWAESSQKKPAAVKYAEDLAKIKAQEPVARDHPLEMALNRSMWGQTPMHLFALFLTYVKTCLPGPRCPHSGMKFHPSPNKPDPRVIRAALGSNWALACSRHPHIGRGEGYQKSRAWQMYASGVDNVGRGPEYGMATGGYWGGAHLHSGMQDKSNRLHFGIVKSWHPGAGIGFITPDKESKSPRALQKDVFFHRSSFAGRLGLGNDAIVGERVSYNLQWKPGLMEYCDADARASGHYRAANVMGPGVGEDTEFLAENPPSLPLGSAMTNMADYTTPEPTHPSAWSTKRPVAGPNQINVHIPQYHSPDHLPAALDTTRRLVAHSRDPATADKRITDGSVTDAWRHGGYDTSAGPRMLGDSGGRNMQYGNFVKRDVSKLAHRHVALGPTPEQIAQPSLYP